MIPAKEPNMPNKIEPIPRTAHATLPDFVFRHFQRSDAESNHLQLYRIIRDGIQCAALPAGSKLPPSREMAQALGI